MFCNITGKTHSYRTNIYDDYANMFKYITEHVQSHNRFLVIEHVTEHVLSESFR